ncbi:hypothetical protein ACLB2K_040847 [Fragaria x ananassa]
MFNDKTRRNIVGIDDGHKRALVVKGRDKNSGPKFSVTCHYCGEKGHMKRMCRKWKQDKRKSKYQDDEDNGFTATVSGDLFTVQECLYVGDKYHDWLVDTDASCHVTSNLELFTTYEASDFEILKMGNRDWSKISGMLKMVNKSSTTRDMVMSCSIRGSCTLQPRNSASSQLRRTPGNGVALVFLPHGLEGEIVRFAAHLFFLRCFVLEYGVPIRK